MIYDKNEDQSDLVFASTDLLAVLAVLGCVGGVGVVVCTPTKCWHFLLLVLGLWCDSGPWFCLSLILLLFEVSD